MTSKHRDVIQFQNRALGNSHCQHIALGSVRSLDLGLPKFFFQNYTIHAHVYIYIFIIVFRRKWKITKSRRKFWETLEFAGESWWIWGDSLSNHKLEKEKEGYMTRRRLWKIFSVVIGLDLRHETDANIRRTSKSSDTWGQTQNRNAFETWKNGKREGENLSLPGSKWSHISPQTFAVQTNT